MNRGPSFSRAAVFTTLIATTVVAQAVSCEPKKLDDPSQNSLVKNTCKVDSDCKTVDDQEATCGAGMCVASVGQLDTVYLEVMPTASAFWGAGESFLLQLTDMTRSSWNNHLVLPKLARIAGKVLINPILLGNPVSEACTEAFDPTSNTLGVHVQLSRSEANLGLPSAQLAAKAQKTRSGPWEFNTTVPSGVYDVYVTALAGCEVDFPPIFIPNQRFDSEDVKFDLSVSSLANLSGVVSGPADGQGPKTLAGWQVSLISADHGNVISTTRKLGSSVPTNFTLVYQASDKDTVLLRLQPPPHEIAPEMFWDLAVLDLDGDGHVQIDLESLDLSTVKVTGTVIDTALDPVDQASIWLRSNKLSGASQGLIATYEAMSSSSEDGSFSMMLLPGTYQVITTPPGSSTLLMTETTWSVASSPVSQAGRTVELGTSQLLKGTVVEPVHGRGVENLHISVVPLSRARDSFADGLLAPPPSTPRSTSGMTDEQGWFSLAVDPGVMVFRASFSRESNYPWLTIPAVSVESSPLGELHLRFPVPFSGKLQDPGGNAIQQALLRVFAVLEETDIHGAVQIAEGRTDNEGNFMLLLPSQLGN